MSLFVCLFVFLLVFPPLQLSIAGYNDKQKVLLERILEKMANFKTLPERFHLIKEHLELSFKNWDFEAPHEHVIFNLTCALQEIVWTDKEKLECLKDLQPHDLDEFARHIFSRAYFECLLHGNMSREAALEIVDVLEKKLAPKKLYEFEKLGSRAVCLPQGGEIVLLVFL
jgi:insulysin